MKVFLSSKADRYLHKLPPNIHDKIIDHLENLAANPYPSNSEKLSGRPGWRLRIGDYRAIYTLNTKTKTIIILSVAHRKDAYR